MGDYQQFGKLGREMHTQASHPQKEASRFPVFNDVPLCEPRGRSKVMHFTSNIVTCPGVRRGQPTPKHLPKLVTYSKFSLYIPKMAISEVYERSAFVTFTAISCMETSIQR